MNSLPKVLEYYSPHKMSKRSLDRRLASCWFRTTNMLFRTQITCFDNTICSPINVRLRLDTYEFSKRFRKLLKKNKELFRYEIRKATSLYQYEDMFAQHQKRFRSFLCGSLQEFLVLSPNFDTYEICVYDEDRLVAVSFFDFGHEGVMSLLGLFDYRYSSYSLGLFTMLIEIEYAMFQGFKLYYPGYVHNDPSVYDYKLRLGKVETYNWKTKRWVQNADPHQMPNISVVINQQTHLLQQLLHDLGIEYDRKINLFFGWHYYQEAYRELYRYPLMLIFKDATALAYDPEKQMYVHSELELYIPYRDIRLVLADDFDRKMHFMDVMKERKILCSTNNVEVLQEYLDNYFPADFRN